MKYKALMIDVDRTLVTSQKALPSKRVKEAIVKVKKEKNIHISLVTARPYNQIKHICDDLKLSGFCIVSGGARIVDVSTGIFYHEYCLEYQTIQKISNIIQNIDPNIISWIQDNGTDYPLDATYKPYKPLVMVISSLNKEQEKQINEQLSHILCIFFTKTKSYKKGFLDINITHENATKQKGIAVVARHLGITKEEIVAVGDGHNDHTLFLGSGVKIAMGNAVDEIKELADYTAPSVEEDGVAHVIEKYFINPIQQ